MLPPRSKRAAVEDAPAPRLRLITPWQLAIAVALLAVLFTLVFPRRALLESLYHQDRFDDLTLAYIDNLRRVNTGDDDLTILVVRTRLNETPFADIEKALLPIITGRDDRLRTRAGHALAAAAVREMQRLLLDYSGEEQILAQLSLRYGQIRDLGDDRQRQEALPLWIEVLLRTPRERLKSDPDLWNRVRELLAEAERMQWDGPGRSEVIALAMHVGLEHKATRLLDHVVAREEVVTTLRRFAETALGRGQYETAGLLFLLARERASSASEARECFRRGIASFMAGGLYSAAMDVADRHLGDLDGDPETMRFLIRTALAAGAPQRAAIYARHLVFRSPVEGRPR